MQIQLIIFHLDPLNMMFKESRNYLFGYTSRNEIVYIMHLVIFRHNELDRHSLINKSFTFIQNEKFYFSFCNINDGLQNEK